MNQPTGSSTVSAHDAAEQTRVAVLGTLAEYHGEPIPYDLAALVKLVSDIQPDLLCLDMTKEQWQTQDFGGLPPEYRKALLPLAYQTDIVVATIAGERPPSEPTAIGWRGWLMEILRGWLAQIQRGASGPDAINHGWRHDLANLFYMAILLLDGPACQRSWQAYTDQLIQAVLQTVRRDPGRRVLVVVNIRHCHHIRPALRKEPDVSVVHHNEL